MKKRLVSLLLAVIMVCSMIPTAFAATDEATQAAQALYELGLFKGTGTNADGTPIFDLDKTPTRNQAIIMLVRLLGKEEEALAGTWDIPFTDVTDAMKPYIGYAYANGLTNGYTATTYNGTAPIKANQYVTFVLRALGYESGKDFEVTSPWGLSDKIGITANQYDSTAFTRGDVAMISNSSLDVPCKDGDKPLIKVLGMERLDGEPSGTKTITQLSEAIPGSWSYTYMYNGDVGFQFEYVFCEGSDFFGSRYTNDGVYELYTGTYKLKGNQLTIDIDINAVVDGEIYVDNRQEMYTVQVVDGKLALGSMQATAITDLPLTDKVTAMVESILNPTASVNPSTGTTSETSVSDLNSIRVSVLEKYRAALVDVSDGCEIMAQAATFAQYGSYSTATDKAKSAQRKFAAALFEYQEAAELCGDYPENAEVKRLLQDEASKLTKIVSFKLIDGSAYSLLEFVESFPTLENEKIIEAANKWWQ